MPDWFEFHDSCIQSAGVGTNGLVLLIDGYIHHWERVDGNWIGTGRSQPVRICIGAPASGPVVTEEPLHGGCLTVADGVHTNWLRIPFSATGDVTLRFDLRATANPLHFSGRDVTVEIVGEGEFVETLGDDMRPTELG
jgi:hypothetical protein